MKLTQATLRLFVIVLGLLTAFAALAQGSISGQVWSADTDSGLPFAHVKVLTVSDSTFVAATVGDIHGSFSLDLVPGNYIVHVSLLGYQTHRQDVEINNQRIDLHRISLAEDTKLLEAVVVRGQRPLLERRVDRTIVHVGERLTTSGNSALEILEKSPGVIVNRQSNSIDLYGKSGVQVMINGKMSQMPLDAIVQMLDGMSGDRIDKIELITTPPAKYDATGNAGIIHLILKDAADLGTHGQLSLVGGYNHGETFGGNVHLDHRKNRLSYFVDYSYRNDLNRHLWLTRQEIPIEDGRLLTTTNSRRTPRITVQSFETGVGYDLDRTSLKFVLGGYRRVWEMDATTTDQRRQLSQVMTAMELHEMNRWQSLSAGLGIRHHISDGQDIEVTFDELHYLNNNPSDYSISTEGGNDQQQSQLSVTKDTPIRFRVVKADYTLKKGSSFLSEFGAKGSFSRFSNDARVNVNEDGLFMEDPYLSNRTQLQEDIWATYGSSTWSSGSWQVRGGVRYEYTQTRLSDEEGELLGDRSYGNFFPNLSISRSIGKEQSLYTNYSRRITRPSMNDLAPFFFFISPNSFINGNLSLRPAINDMVEVGYQLRSWSTTIGYSHVANQIVILQPEVDQETGAQVYRSQNLRFLNTFTISSSLPLAIAPWWQTNSTLTVNRYDYATQHLPQNVTRSLWAATFNGSWTFLLPRDFSAEVSGTFQSRGLLGLFTFEPMGQLNLAVKKELKSGRGSLTLAATDVLNTGIWRMDSDLPEGQMDSFIRYDWGLRAINLTYRVSFGNKKLSAVKIGSGATSEKSRVN
ncbi:MAG: outer membrane beta-barrel family protein [Bacteroidota bacterium]